MKINLLGKWDREYTVVSFLKNLNIKKKNLWIFNSLPRLPPKEVTFSGFSSARWVAGTSVCRSVPHRLLDHRSFQHPRQMLRPSEEGLMLGRPRKGSVLPCVFLNKALWEPQGEQAWQGGWMGCVGSPGRRPGWWREGSRAGQRCARETLLSWGQGSKNPNRDVGCGALGL